jgi:hypothetical protein
MFKVMVDRGAPAGWIFSTILSGSSPASSTSWSVSSLDSWTSCGLMSLSRC